MNDDALDYHAEGRPGKLAIRATKPLSSQRDLSLAYSPGVAEACRAIVERSDDARRYTARGNLVGVVTNGSAVLGLGDIGALASKPVMEGKAVLFKTFADIDVFDIEIDESDPDAFADTVRRLEPTFGAINLEDIKAPDCFRIERRLREEMSIPVFHDDQHGTAIVVGAAVVNAMILADKSLDAVKLVSTGGGAAGIACLDLLLTLGLKREQVWLCDEHGLVYDGRDAEPEKRAYAQPGGARDLDDVIDDADIFLGLSVPELLSPEQVGRMAADPLILALANPVPEILPEKATAARSDAIVCTGRTDYPNQVNNVLCFPFIFRGALDAGATSINDEMKAACVEALAELAREGATEEVKAAYDDQPLSFGPQYLLPKPFDPRLLSKLAPAVARAAADSGVATRPIEDLDDYRARLTRFVYKTAMLMRPVFDAARGQPRRVIFAEGEDHRVLHAVQSILDEGVARPIVTGRREIIRDRCRDLGLRVRPDDDFEVLDHAEQSIIEHYAKTLHRRCARDGIGPELAERLIRGSDTLAAAIHVCHDDADTMICGTQGDYRVHLERLLPVFDDRRSAPCVFSMVPLILEGGSIFVVDGYVNYSPSAEEIAGMARLAAAEVARLGLTPRVALVSHTNFGAVRDESTRRMRAVYEILDRDGADFEFEGEMRLELAFDSAKRERALPGSRLTEDANILVFCGIDAANAAIDALSTVAGAQTIGPLLLGLSGAAHIVTPSVSARGLLNVAAMSSACAT